jgi:hypothetical protein
VHFLFLTFNRQAKAAASNTSAGSPPSLQGDIASIKALPETMVCRR